jgi:hypothetical protein
MRVVLGDRENRIKAGVLQIRERLCSRKLTSFEKVFADRIVACYPPFPEMFPAQTSVS